MKKLKNLWMNNRILLILGVILLACFIAIIVVTTTFFVGNKKSADGGRCENLKVQISDKEQNEYVSKVEENPNVEKVRFRVRCKTIYISVKFKNDVKLEDKKKAVEDSLELLSDKVKETYDMNFTINLDEKTHMMASRNVSGNGLSWNNNTPVEEKKE